MGRQSSQIADLLGFRGRDEMIHRDDLVLLPRAAVPEQATQALPP
jgi:glutamate 5-kinase